ncbi:hypothetical protein AND_010120 [Anopheles darlingi]|uniref:Uncharacterized protein n=1 Tax=Anopheles darlingi TaxID=43151 RepID=W5J664_ANODA|nr:hypothetical protein AND_010120 [Anopheles darlingi]
MDGSFDRVPVQPNRGFRSHPGATNVEVTNFMCSAVVHRAGEHRHIQLMTKLSSSSLPSSGRGTVYYSRNPPTDEDAYTLAY